MTSVTAVVAFVALAASPGTDDVQRSYADVGGAKLYYEISGVGPPVVLLHGGLNTIETTYSKLIPELVRKHRIIGIEQVGHGHTADLDGPLAFDKMAVQTAALLKQVGLGRVDLVGWSDGGIIALLVAAKHPDLVRRVVISGANTRLDGLPAETIKSLRETTGEELAKRMRKELRDAYERLSPDGPGHWPVIVTKVRELWLTPVPVEKHQLAAIEAPTLVIAGDSDRFATVEHSVEIFRSLRKGQLWIVPGTGHNTFGDRPAWMAAVISEFLAAPEKPEK